MRLGTNGKFASIWTCFIFHIDSIICCGSIATMSVPLSTVTDFFPKDDDEELVIRRVDSGETNESPFGSNLATPIDEDAFFHKGIHELLDIAEKKGDYFGTDEVQIGVEKSESMLEGGIKPLDEFMVKRCTMALGSENESLSTSPSDSMRFIASPDFSSSESIPIPKTASIYNLPNEHILIEDPSNVFKSEVDNKEDDLLEEDNDQGSFPTVSSLYLTQSFIAKSLTISKIFHLVIRILCFLPWCIAVGGALVLFPDHLEYLAFQTGYLTSPIGIRRFSHWFQYGMEHIIIFVAFLGLFAFVFPTTGSLLIGGLLGQFYHVWNNFSLDRTVPLGTDDLQTVYLLATTDWLKGTSVYIKKVDNDYYSLGEYEIEGLRQTGEA